MLRCAEWLAEHMRSIGLEHVEVIATPGHSAVYADWLHAEGKPTVLVYNHYDVQPSIRLTSGRRRTVRADVREGGCSSRRTDDKGQLCCT